MIQPPPLNDQVTGQDKQFSVGWKRWINYLQRIVFAVGNYGVASYLQPSTGFSAQVPQDIGILLLDPAAVLATGTVFLPAYPVDQQHVLVSTTAAITALTVSVAAGQTIRNPPSTLAAGAAFEYYYVASSKTWYNVSAGSTGGGGGGGGGSGTVTAFSASGPLSGGITTAVISPTTTPNLTIALAGNLLGVDTLSTIGFVRRLAGNVWATTPTIALTSQVAGVLPVANGGVPTATTNGWVLTLAAGLPVWQVGGGGGGGGTSKVTASAVALGTQAGSQPAFTYTTIPSICARGIMTQILVTPSIAGNFDLVIRGAGVDTGTLWLNAVAVTAAAFLVTLPIYVENDVAAQNFYIGIRNNSPNSATFTLTFLRVEKFA